nr:hypothetical protein [Tanacetum cinerariifolium]
MDVLQHEHPLTLIDLNPEYPRDEVVYDDEDELIMKQDFRCSCGRCGQEINFCHSYHLYTSIARSQRTFANGSQFNYNITAKDKNPKPNHSSYPNNIPLKKKDKFHDLPSFTSVTNGIAKPTVDTSSTNANIRVLVLDDQDLVNVEDPSMVLSVKLNDVNSMSNMYVICRNEAHNFESNALLKSIYSCIKTTIPSFKVDERMIWIEIRGLPLCAWGSNAYKKVADMFGKFMFFEDEESTKISSGTWNINIVDETLDSSDNIDVNGMEHLNSMSNMYVICRNVERVLVEVHGVNYDVHVYGLGTWNINIVDETLFPPTT